MINQKRARLVHPLLPGMPLEELTDHLIDELVCRGWPYQPLREAAAGGAFYSREASALVFLPDNWRAHVTRTRRENWPRGGGSGGRAA